MMSPASQSKQQWRFDGYELDIHAGELRKNGIRLRLQGQPLQVLATLVKRQGSLVTREELRAEIWPADTFVDFDHSLHNAVARIRETLGDSAQAPKYVETLPRRGYRFVAQVEGPEPEVSETLDLPSSVSVRSPGHEAKGIAASPKPFRSKLMTALAVLVALALLSLLFWQGRSRSPVSASSTGPITIAVLPFQNLSLSKDVDYLTLALPDEIATTLSYAHSLSIRPFATSSKYTAANLDLQQVGREMKVDHLITGQFLKEGSGIRVTIEAVDVANDRTLCRETVTTPGFDLIALRAEITARVRQGVVPALGGTIASAEGSGRPKNEEAYGLYLRSVSLPNDPGPTKEAIGMLTRAVKLDPDFAPSWAMLGIRYGYDSEYSDGGTDMLQRSNEALQRSIALDPDYLLAATWLITNQTESGDLAHAYQAARGLEQRRPENGLVHFAMSYVLRYASLLDESAQECEAALLLDPGDYQLRSCHWTYEMMGQPEKGAKFLKLDEGSVWTVGHMPITLIREGKIPEAKEAAKKLTDIPLYRGLMKRWLAGTSSPQELEQQARAAVPVFLADTDAENRYFAAGLMSYFGQQGFAVQLMRSAIAGNYCSYTGLQNDVLFASLRSAPEYNDLLTAAKNCRDRFVGERDAPSPARGGS